MRKDQKTSLPKPIFHTEDCDTREIKPRKLPTPATNLELRRLIQDASHAREKAYAPYSHFAVGAALLTRKGNIFHGCNVENLSFGLTICAERVAVAAAVLAGDTDFVAAAVVSDSVTPITPCGACRQVLAEFVDDLPICSANLVGEVSVSTLDQLLPRAKAGILGT